VYKEKKGENSIPDHPSSFTFIQSIIKYLPLIIPYFSVKKNKSLKFLILIIKKSVIGKIVLLLNIV